MLSKLGKLIGGVIELIKNPWLLNIVLADDSVWMKKLQQDYPKQTILPVVDLGTLFPGFHEKLSHFGFLGGGSLPTDLALLTMLSKRFEACKYFEIGTWRGESVINVANHAAECYTLNLSKAEILKLGVTEKYADLHGFFSKGKSNITHLTGDSRYFDYAGLNKKFDLIFIDGDHHYDFVKSDTAKVFEHLVHEKSIIVWHDYAYHPEKVRPEVLKGILDGTPADFHKNLYHVSNTMCAIFTREDLKSGKLEAPVRPKVRFEVDLKEVKVE